MTSNTYDRVYSELLKLFADAEAVPDQCASNALRVAASLDTLASLSAPEAAALRYVCSSIVINVGSALGDASLLDAGRREADRAGAAVGQAHALFFQCRYNVANATGELCGLDLPGEEQRDWRAQLVENRLANRLALREVRGSYLAVASSDYVDPHTRSAALCNLANMLDQSGRWAEAYDYYLLALQVDPSNGNAAGNIAQLLASRIVSGVGQTGHIAALYDKYLAMAKELRDGTVNYAGEAAAQRWDALEFTNSEGHLAHGVDDTDVRDAAYRAWIALHRLALSPAVEGLGTDDPQWDSATVGELYGASIDDVNPPLLAEMNVLKADYLVSRRLAYEGVLGVNEGPEQRPEDSGLYSETHDGALYGTQYAQLLLAQRSALDVLDKTAVVANEYFHVGERPTRVSFRRFWSTQDGALRSAIASTPERALPTLALAELASDIDEPGMYAASQALRNAGTHRIVHATETGVSRISLDTRNAIEVDHLIDSTVVALQVTRSAYLYLIDLVAAWNRVEDHPGAHNIVRSATYRHGPQQTPGGLAKP